jgi:ornithine cyclodeaminase
MTQPEIIPFAEGEAKLDWIGLTEAFKTSHKLPKAEISDTLLYRGKDTMLSRAAWIDGVGALVKTAMIFPDNPTRGEPLIYGGVNLYDDVNGSLSAILDFQLVTKWKTAGDSLLGALTLARKDSRKILIVGAGTVGHTLREAYCVGFPDAEFLIWNRSADKAKAFADQYDKTTAIEDLETAIGQADIVTSATMTSEPVIKGDWLQSGQHVDVIGAYKPDMRELDDTALTRGRVFCDSFDTTIHHIGEFIDPIAAGVISESDILADYYSIENMTRQSDDDITIFKNGGGAHLDLMTSAYILDRWRNG